MSTRVAIYSAIVVWAGFARLCYYAIWERRWKRPTHVKRHY